MTNTIENIRLPSFKEDNPTVWEKWESRLPVIFGLVLVLAVTYLELVQNKIIQGYWMWLNT